MSTPGRPVSLVDGSELGDVGKSPGVTRRVQFCERLTDERFRHLASLLEERPQIDLRACLGDGITDLELLRFFSGLRSFQVDHGPRRKPVHPKSRTTGFEPIQQQALYRFYQRADPDPPTMRP